MINRSRHKLGQILKAAKLVTDQQIQQALRYQQEEGVKIGEALIQLGFCSDVHVTKALAKQHGLPFIDLGKYMEKLPAELLKSVPRAIIEEYQIIPVQKKGGKLTVACAEPLDLIVLDNLRFTLGCEVNCALSTPGALEDAIGKFYNLEEANLHSLYDEMTQTDIEFGRGGDTGDEGDTEDSDLIRLVNMVISEAIKGRASDIHIEPMEKRLRIRYRVDGRCMEVDPPPKRLQGPILARVKIMSDMDIAEKRKTQDGRIKMNFQGRDVDFRVSALPARHGESIVLRILDKSKALVDLEILGFHPSDYARFSRIISRPNGIFLVTGPTGSGKTTTLYAALKELNRPDVKIITAENPVEYNITGINQCQVNHRIGLTFGRILRAMLRQAPNIILVGEIRDKETADIAIQAALTGHLVFSTLHTNDAPSAITRLTDMGVKPFLVASAIQAIMAQRLVRMLCPHCKEPVTPAPADLRMVGLREEDVANTVVYGAVGCGECNHYGFHGRQGIFELLEMAPAMRELAFHKAPVQKLSTEARLSGGMLTLQEDGIRKILEGKTTIEEILKCTHRDDI